MARWQISRCVSGESGLKTIFSSKRPMSSGRKNRCSSENNRPFQGPERKARWTQELLCPNVARADEVKAGKVVGAMVGERDARGIEHLQKEIPYQPVGLFDFIEQQNSAVVLPEDGSQASRSAGFIAHEELHVVQVQELRHIETKGTLVAEKVAGEFQREFGFADARRPEEKE